MHGLSDDAPERVMWKECQESLTAADPTLARIIKKLGAPKIHVIADPFEAIARGIVRQQLNAAAAEAIIGRLAQATDGKFPTAGQIMTMGVKALREAGLPEARARALWEVSRTVAERGFDFEALETLSDGEAEARLITLPGVGPWTARMYLVFSLGRPDVLIGGDVALAKAVQRIYELPAPPTDKELEEMAEKWRPFRSAATWYIWKISGGFTPGLR